MKLTPVPQIQSLILALYNTVYLLAY